MRLLSGFLCFVALATGCAAQELQHGSFEEKTFASKSLDREVAYGIYRPKEAKGPLPLIIWLHGMREDHMRFNRRGGAATLDRMIGKGEVPPCILVSPNGERYGFWIDGKDSGPFESLVTKDLLGHLKATYPIAEARERRAIAGVSMGGLGALKIALKDPSLFGAVSAHSAALFPPDPANLSPRFKRAYESWGRRIGLDSIFGRPIDEKIWVANNPLALAMKCSKEALAKIKIRFDAGTDDRYGFHEPGEALHRLFQKRGVEHEWRSLEGVGHSWGSGSMDKRLQAGLRFIAGHWKEHAAPAPEKQGGGS